LAGRFCQIWLQPKHESKLKKYPLYFWLPTLNKVKKIWRFFPKIWLNSGYWKNLKKYMLLAFKILLYSFLSVVYIASKRKAGTSDQHFSKE
jgi:hypothetical protein